MQLSPVDVEPDMTSTADSGILVISLINSGIVGLDAHQEW